jgi:hypothetical protein
VGKCLEFREVRIRWECLERAVEESTEGSLEGWKLGRGFVS